MEELCALLLFEAIREEASHKAHSSTYLNVAFVASRGNYSHQGNRGFSYPTRGFRGGFRGNKVVGFTLVEGDIEVETDLIQEIPSGSSQGSPSYTHGSQNSQSLNPNSGFSHGTSSYSHGSSSSGGVLCHICDKPSHVAYDYWHRLNLDYQLQSANSLSGS